MKKWKIVVIIIGFLLFRLLLDLGGVTLVFNFIFPNISLPEVFSLISQGTLVPATTVTSSTAPEQPVITTPATSEEITPCSMLTPDLAAQIAEREVRNTNDRNLTTQKSCGYSLVADSTSEYASVYLQIWVKKTSVQARSFYNTLYDQSLNGVGTPGENIVKKPGTATVTPVTHHPQLINDLAEAAYIEEKGTHDGARVVFLKGPYVVNVIVDSTYLDDRAKSLAAARLIATMFN